MSSQAPTGDASLGHVPALDGVRGVAVLLVLLFHAGVGRFSGGFLGVSTFFTLSGFLVGSILATEADRRGGIGLRRFWERRLRRLLPACLAAVVLCLVIGRVLGAPADASALRWEAISSATFWSNWRFLAAGRSYGDLFSAPSPFDHFWSLAIEAQLYVVAPLLLLLLRPLRRTSVRVAGVLLAAAGSTAAAVLLFVPGADNGRVYYGTDTRAAEFLIGMAAALAVTAWRSRAVAPPSPALTLPLGAAGLAVVVGLPLLGSLSDPWVYRGGFALNAVGAAALVVALVWRAPVLSPAMSWSPLRSVGRVSYGVYLYHWPVFVLLTEQRLGWGFWPTLAARLALTAALTLLSHRFVEMPLRTATVVPSRLWWRFASVGTAAALLAAVLVPLGAVTPVEVSASTGGSSGPRVVRPATTAGAPTTTTATTDPSAAPGTGAAAPPSTTAAPRDPSADGLRLAVVGDADGVRFGQSLQGWAARDGRFAVSAVEPWGCAAPGCAPWAARWPALVASSGADLLVLSVANYDPVAVGAGLGPAPAEGVASWLTDGLTAALAAVAAAGVPVVWMTVPEPDGNDLRRRAVPANAVLYQALGAAVGATAEARQLAVETQYNDVLRDGGEPADRFPVVAALAGPRLAAVAQSLVPGVPRVLVVGDSVARSLGAGLEAWGSSGGGVSVWDVSRDGCGLLLDGDVQGLYAGMAPLPADCAATAARWPQQIADFRPDAVVVLSTIWDLADRRLPEWGSVRRPTDPVFDQYLVSRYGAFVDMVRGASPATRVVWLNVPCVDATHGGLPFGTPRTRTAFDADRRNHVNRVLLPQVAAARPGAVSLVDFAAEVCPGGRFSEQLGDVAAARPDGVHFSLAGALWVSRTFAAGWLGR